MVYCVTRQADGRWMKTQKLPKIVPVEDAEGGFDAYVAEGDPTGYRNICRRYVRDHYTEALDLEPLESMWFEVPKATPIPTPIFAEDLT